MSWKYIVIIALSVFVLGMLGMVFLAQRQTNEMIDDHYYDKELKYQGVIDGKEKLNALHDSILVMQIESTIQIKMPAGASKNISEGAIEFLRSADKSKDKTYMVQPDSAGIQIVPKADFIKGIYRMRARWKSNNVEYFDERDIVIQ